MSALTQLQRTLAKAKRCGTKDYYCRISKYYRGVVGGKDWTNLLGSSLVLNGIKSIVATDILTALAVGNTNPLSESDSGLVSKTIDGGATWRTVLTVDSTKTPNGETNNQLIGSTVTPGTNGMDIWVVGGG